MFARVAWRGTREVQGSSDPRVKFLSTLLLDQTGLPSEADSAALPTSFGGKGPHLKQ